VARDALGRPAPSGAAAAAAQQRGAGVAAMLAQPGQMEAMVDQALDNMVRGIF
jgi:hypothetical protein